MERLKIRCSCGKLIEGYGEKHVKANLQLHKRAKSHKEHQEIKLSGFHKMTPSSARANRIKSSGVHRITPRGRLH